MGEACANYRIEQEGSTFVVIINSIVKKQTPGQALASALEEVYVLAEQQHLEVIQVITLTWERLEAVVRTKRREPLH